MWEWLKDEKNQKALTVLGGAIAASIAAGWTVFVFYDNKKPAPISRTYSMCIGEKREFCSNVDWGRCGTSPISLAKGNHPKECVQVDVKMILDLAGDACGYKTFEVQCKN